MLEIGDMQAMYLRNGNRRYLVELAHRGLKKHQVIRGDHEEVVRRKVMMKAAEWEARWIAVKRNEDSRRKRESARRHKEGMVHEASDRTDEAAAVLAALEGLLKATLKVDDTVVWSSLEDHSEFATPKPKEPGKPGGPALREPPSEPLPSEMRFQPDLGLLDRIFRSRGDKKRAEAELMFRRAHKQWTSDCQRVARENDQLRVQYEEQRREWESLRARWDEERLAGNRVIQEQRDAYFAKEPGAVEEYCEMVLSRSVYPDAVALEHEIQYLAETRTAVVECQLPSLDDLPTLREVKYVRSRDEFDEKHLSESQCQKLYDSMLYQICLRTLHELFEADAADAIDAVSLNGNVTSIDRGTGKSVTACILSVQATKGEFLALNLEAVEPKACFKLLKGVGSSKLHSMTPVAPILQFRKDDGRFVSAREVVGGLDEGVNLAAMDWEDFEHLIRELFEQEFKSNGGEVSITRASRDGGVDAVAFDPDPIRGGKIVIQAKRYTNVVGVAAVRDLYGTVMNEGATKGILVTTSDYGPDAYNFAKDKPLTLMSGSNLLHLLQKHGHRARIDVQEARARMRAEVEQ